MDENYLDGLLDNVSSDKEQMNIDKNVDRDAGINLDDLDIGDISLDELDDLDNINLDDFNFDDIDFDDLDVTSLDTKTGDKDGEEKLDLSELIDDEEADISDQTEAVSEKASEKDPEEAMDILSELDNLEADASFTDDVFTAANEQVRDDEENAYTDNTVQSILDDNDTSGMSGMDLNELLLNNEEAMNEQTADAADIDDLFSALGINDDSSDNGNESNPYTSGEGELDDLLTASLAASDGISGLDDIRDISEVKGRRRKKKVKRSKEKGQDKDAIIGADSEAKLKKTVSEFIFGEPDEDDEAEEALLEAKKADKAAKKAKKKEDLEAKKVQQEEKKALKSKESDSKNKEKAAKKQAKEEEYKAELEAEKDTKKVSNITVAIVFVLFAALFALVFLGTNSFNYAQVIKKAADYFDRQKYRQAYEQVAGVDVKEKDEDLRDRIYTVMYVERLYESYQNNMNLNRPDKALDALVRGLQKYDEHYDEAVELNIVEDIDYCKIQIINALFNTYGMSEQDAYSLIELDGQKYTQALEGYCAGLQTGE